MQFFEQWLKLNSFTYGSPILSSVIYRLRYDFSSDLWLAVAALIFLLLNLFEVGRKIVFVGLRKNRIVTFKLALCVCWSLQIIGENMLFGSPESPRELLYSYSHMLPWLHVIYYHRRYNIQIQQLAASCCQSPLQQWCSVTLSRSHVTRHLYTKIVLSRTF